MPPSADSAIRITVLDDRRSEECQVGCGIDWASPETMALVSQRIKDAFGDRVEIEYLNMFQTETSLDMLQWKEVIQNKNLLSPLLLLNGQLRLSGPFDIRQLVEAIEVETEIGI